MSSIKVYDLAEHKIVDEKVYGGQIVKSFYSTRPMGFFIKRRWIQKMLSHLVGAYKRSGRSRRQIEPFLKQYSMNLEGYHVPDKGFRNFNEFFIRKKIDVLFPED